MDRALSRRSIWQRTPLLLIVRRLFGSLWMIALLTSGCTTLQPSVATSYCLSRDTGGCSEFSVNGECSRCP